MFRSRLLVSQLLVLVPCVWLAVDAPSANAQRLRDRLRNRIQAAQSYQPRPQYRAPVQNQPMQNQRLQNQPAQRPNQAFGNGLKQVSPQFQPRQPKVDSRSGVPMQRVSPLTPQQLGPRQVRGGQIHPQQQDPKLRHPNQQNPSVGAPKPGAKPVATLPARTSPAQRSPASTSPASTSLGSSILSRPNQSPQLAAPVTSATAAPKSPVAKPVVAAKAATKPNPVSQASGTMEVVPPASAQPIEAKPSLGIEVVPNGDGIAGLRVRKIQPGSLVGAAGLHVNDVIVSVDGKPTPTVAEITAIFRTHQPGDRVPARIVRGRQTAALSLPLVDRAKLKAIAAKRSSAIGSSHKTTKPDTGLKVAEKAGVRGLIVSEVGRRSLAENAGVQVGDRIISLGGRMMTSVNALDGQIQALRVGDKAELHLVRDGKLVTVDLVFAEPAKTQGREPSGSSVPGSTVLSDVGSALGDFFGKKSTEKNDEMAFGDEEESVVQVDFQEDVKNRLEKMNEDPPSLESIDVPEPTIQELPPAAKPSGEELREEIRRLEEKLQKLQEEKSK